VTFYDIPEIVINYFLEEKSLLNKAPFWAILWQKLGDFFRQTSGHTVSVCHQVFVSISSSERVSPRHLWKQSFIFFICVELGWDLFVRARVGLGFRLWARAFLGLEKFTK
jgi:hypothetical protein